MELYLMRHGEAKPETQDPDRPLTDRGRREVEMVARHAARIMARPVEIRHSGKRRAEQTAVILAGHVSPLRGVRAVKGLAPDDDPSLLEKDLRGAKEPLCLVGHLPHLGHLASLLLAGSPDGAAISLAAGAIVCLEQSKNGWKHRWTLSPEGSPG